MDGALIALLVRAASRRARTPSRGGTRATPPRPARAARPPRAARARSARRRRCRPRPAGSARSPLRRRPPARPARPARTWARCRSPGGSRAACPGRRPRPPARAPPCARAGARRGDRAAAAAAHAVQVDRDAAARGEPRERFDAVVPPHRRAAEQDRPLGAGEERERGVELSRIAGRARVGAVRALRVRERLVGAVRGDVPGELEEHRTGPPGARDAERLREEARDEIGGRDTVRPLRDAGEELDLRHLLQGAAPWLNVGAAPPRRTSGTFAAQAFATPVTASVTPGPAVTMATPAPRVRRAQASAACAAACSWRVSTRRIPSSTQPA